MWMSQPEQRCHILVQWITCKIQDSGQTSRIRKRINFGRSRAHFPREISLKNITETTAVSQNDRKKIETLIEIHDGKQKLGKLEALNIKLTKVQVSCWFTILFWALSKKSQTLLKRCLWSYLLLLENNLVLLVRLKVSHLERHSVIATLAHAQSFDRCLASPYHSDLRFATFPCLNATENPTILIGSLHWLQLVPMN